MAGPDNACPARRHQSGGLAELLDVELITLCRMIDRLQEAGLVERRPDLTDRRAWLLFLFHKAGGLLDELRPLGLNLFDEAMNGLNALEREGFAQHAGTYSRKPLVAQPRSLLHMADADAHIVLEDAIPIDEPKLPSRWRRLGLMVSLPLLLIGGGVTYYVLNDHYVSTDNAYVQQDKVSVSAEVGGRIIEVAVKENQDVKAGDLLFRIDLNPGRIAVAQARTRQLLRRRVASAWKRHFKSAATTSIVPARTSISSRRNIVDNQTMVAISRPGSTAVSRT